MSTIANEKLWEFALALYGQPAVEALCLELQDTAGVDVCLLLCAAWCDDRGLAFESACWAKLLAFSADWQSQVVVPLRQVRRYLRAPVYQQEEIQEYRQQVSQAELAAEKLQLQQLQSLVEGWPARESVTGELPAVEAYLHSRCQPEVVLQALVVLRSAILAVDN